MRAEKRLVTRIWHPEAVGDLFDIGNGVNAVVVVGDPAYQVTSGDIVAL